MTSITMSRTSRDRVGPARWTQVDYLLIVTTVGLCLFGCVIVFSSTRGTGDVANTAFLQRQVVAIVLGGIGCVTAALIDFRRLLSYLSIGYLGLLGLLAAVLVVGQEVNGARAWFRFGPLQLQPSEFGKVLMILLMANVLAQGANDYKAIGTAIALAGPPIALILLQPDLGTVLVYGVILLVALVVAGVSSRLLLLLFVGLVTVATLLIGSGVLAGYQVDRLLSFVEENCDPDVSETCYNVEQAQVAIGNGGLYGEGIFNGTQTQSNLVPEQQTDFIFTAVGEEMGFTGGVLLLSLYGVLMMRIWRVANLAHDQSGTLLCVGVIAMLVFQVFQNIGMNLGIMPVTGIPLPLVSYGGSSVITTLVAIGLVQNVHFRRFT